MQSPPVSPRSAPTMESLLRVELASLRTDVVLMYADKVASMGGPRPIAPDKTQMLFVLAQKLLRWFIHERRELDRLTQTLQEELVTALRSSLPAPSHESADADASENENPMPVPEQVDEAASLCSSPERKQAMDEVKQDSSLCGSGGEREERVEHSEVETQTEELETPPPPSLTATVEMQTEPAISTSDAATITEEEVDAQESAPLVLVPECVAGATQTDQLQCDEALTQTETPPLAHTQQQTECDAVAVSIDHETQTTAHAETIDHHSQTERAAVVEVQVQVVSEELPTDDLQCTVSTAVVTDCVGLVGSSNHSPLDSLAVYMKVHASIIRAQRIARGYVTRRRFYRMLNELVYTKC